MRSGSGPNEIVDLEVVSETDNHCCSFGRGICFDKGGLPGIV